MSTAPPKTTSSSAPLPTFPDLRGKIAIVTGIGQNESSTDDDLWGNGAAVARLLCYNGVKVIGCDLHLQAAEKTKRRVLQQHPEAVCEACQCDVTQTAEAQALVESVVRRHDRIDILVNNVGAARYGWPHEMSEETWLRQMDINLQCVPSQPTDAREDYSFQTGLFSPAASLPLSSSHGSLTLCGIAQYSAVVAQYCRFSSAKGVVLS